MKGDNKSHSVHFSNHRVVTTEREYLPLGEQGTQIVAHNIFYRYPVRRLAIKWDSEISRIKEFIQKMSFLNYAVTWKLSELGQRINQVSPIVEIGSKSSVTQALIAVYGCSIVSKLQHIDVNFEGYQLTGLISAPRIDCCSSQRDNQLLFLNARWIKRSTVVSSTINKAYQKLLSAQNNPQGFNARHVENQADSRVRYPYFFLQLTCPNDGVYDVLVEPDKSRVFFRNESTVETLTYLLLQQLSATNDMDSLARIVCDMQHPQKMQSHGRALPGRSESEEMRMMLETSPLVHDALVERTLLAHHERMQRVSSKRPLFPSNDVENEGEESGPIAHATSKRRRKYSVFASTDELLNEAFLDNLPHSPGLLPVSNSPSLSVASSALSTVGRVGVTLTRQSEDPSSSHYSPPSPPLLPPRSNSQMMSCSANTQLPPISTLIATIEHTSEEVNIGGGKGIDGEMLCALREGAHWVDKTRQRADTSASSSFSSNLSTALNSATNGKGNDSTIIDARGQRYTPASDVSLNAQHEDNHQPYVIQHEIRGDHVLHRDCSGSVTVQAPVHQIPPPPSPPHHSLAQALRLSLFSARAPQHAHKEHQQQHLDWTFGPPAMVSQEIHSLQRASLQSAQEGLVLVGQVANKYIAAVLYQPSPFPSSATSPPPVLLGDADAKSTHDDPPCMSRYGADYTSDAAINEGDNSHQGNLHDQRNGGNKDAPQRKDAFLVLFDQHAVDERIHFEDLCRTQQVSDSMHVMRPTVLLTSPCVLEVADARIYRVLVERVDLLRAWGFTYRLMPPPSSQRNTGYTSSTPASTRDSASNASSQSVLSSASVEVLSVPRIGEDELLTAQDMLEFCALLQRSHHLDLPESLLRPPAVHRVLCSKACRASIRFGQSLQRQEMTALLQDLAATALPFQCAHGRPSVVPLVEMQRLRAGWTARQRRQMQIDYTQML